MKYSEVKNACEDIVLTHHIPLTLNHKIYIGCKLATEQHAENALWLNKKFSFHSQIKSYLKVIQTLF